MLLKDRIRKDLDLPDDLIDDALSTAHILVRHFKIQKRSGGYRTIYQPSKKLKVIQYWLTYNVFRHMPVHQAATAYRRRQSIRENVERHRHRQFFLKVDFKDFFPSILATDLITRIRDWHTQNTIDWECDSNAESLIQKACFDEHKRLPIGYPTSPIISNIVMFQLDSKLRSLLDEKQAEIGNVEYSRYADDLIFSTNSKNVCRDILGLVESAIDECDSPKLFLNTTKTRLMSSSGGSAFVTGLRICSKGRITIHRRYKDHIRLLLSLMQKGLLKPEDRSSLRGHLSYIKHIDPAFYTKLCEKYFDATSSL